MFLIHLGILIVMRNNNKASISLQDGFKYPVQEPNSRFFFWCCILNLALGAGQACSLQTLFKLAECRHRLILIRKWIYILTAWWLWESTPIPIIPTSLSYFGITELPGLHATLGGNEDVIRVSARFVISYKPTVLLPSIPSLLRSSL